MKGKKERMKSDSIYQASVVQRLDNASVNLYSVDSAISFLSTYPLDGDLSSG